MLLSAFQRLTMVALAATANNPDDIPVVVIILTGMILVFAILFILIGVIQIQGKIFTSAEKRRAAKQQPAQAAAPAPAPVQASPAPVIEAGIPPEVVAAIVAAVSASTDGAFTLRAVQTSKKGRGQWGLAGVIQSTEPF